MNVRKQDSQVASLPAPLTGSASKGAFTLLEILVVVGILSIIALIIVPNTRRHLDRAKVVKTQALVSSLKTAVENYLSDLQAYPPSGSDFLSEALVRGLGDDNPDPRISNDPRWKGPYITFEDDQLRGPSILNEHMPTFDNGNALIPSSATSRSGFSFIVDSWGYPLLYVNLGRAGIVRLAADTGSGTLYEQHGADVTGPYFPAWNEQMASPPSKNEHGQFLNYGTFQIYSVGFDGKTRSAFGGPGTLSVYDGKDNDGDGLVDENDNPRSTQPGKYPPGLDLPEDDVNNW